MTTPTRIPNSAILQLIAKGYLSYQMAQEFHISKPAVSKRIRHLAKKGYINTTKKGVIMTLSLTAKGLAELHPVGDDLVASPSPQKPKGAGPEGALPPQPVSKTSTIKTSIRQHHRHEGYT